MAKSQCVPRQKLGVGLCLPLYAGWVTPARGHLSVPDTGGVTEGSQARQQPSKWQLCVWGRESICHTGCQVGAASNLGPGVREVDRDRRSHWEA